MTITDVFGWPAYDTAAEAITADAIREYLARPNATFWCPMTVTAQGIEDACNKRATTFAALEDGPWSTTPMCTFHANRAGKGNVATLETILTATKENH